MVRVQGKSKVDGVVFRVGLFETWLDRFLLSSCPTSQLIN